MSAQFYVDNKHFQAFYEIKALNGFLKCIYLRGDLFYTSYAAFSPEMGVLLDNILVYE